MVSPNVRSLADSFNSIVQQRDLRGAAVVAVTTAGGGIIAQQVTQRLLPVLGFSASPNNAVGYGASAAAKLLVAGFHGWLGAKVGGTPGLLLMVGGVGAATLAGADVVSLLQRLTVTAEQSLTGSATRSRSVSRAVQSSSTRASPTAAQPASNSSGNEATVGW